MKYISVSDLESIEKDMTLLNGAKHRCIDSTQIYELPKIEIVRCKDCFHKLLVDGKYYCDKPSENSIRFKDPNWYCADGIPKKET